MDNCENRNVLIAGSGGREHALAWKLRQSSWVENIFIVPGNGGTQDVGLNIDIAAHDIDKLAAFAADPRKKIGLTVVGPEDPLAAGIVNVFEKANLPVFGPTQEAAKLESDKGWAVDFMERNHIPHPKSRVFTDYEAALAYVLKEGTGNIVIKASGLALGKGVYLPKEPREAEGILADLMIHETLKDAGKKVVIQERLVGREISVLINSDGKDFLEFPPAQDHKRLLDDDKGPNTGGMGAYAPVPFVTEEMRREIYRTILKPTIDGMLQGGNPFKGVLYAGLMLTSDGPKVLEYNVRFGDPETQPLMMLMSSDLASVLLASAIGSLRGQKMTFYEQFAASIVLASDGYPGSYKKGNDH